MPEIMNKRELSEHATNFAQSYNLIMHNHRLFIPADYETSDASVAPAPERTVWLPLGVQDVQRWARAQYDILFSAHKEEADFYYMVCQNAQPVDDKPTSLLINTEDGLRELHDDGQLRPTTGRFIPNYLPVLLNDNEDDKQELMEVMQHWLDNDEEVLSLLRHLATALAPHWSAVRYVLLIGDGRNGKSLLMSMVQSLFGRQNCAHVTRQDMAKPSPIVMELLNKLVNIVYDGEMQFVKDSANEKTLIAGETLSVRPLYSNKPTLVTTNALFIEALNREPKSSDKSSALQERLIRFWFPNQYPDDLEFKDKMLSDRMVGALLALLLDHYVQRSEKAVMLSPTKTSIELKMEHMLANSPALQFIYWLEMNDPLGSSVLVGMTAAQLTNRFVTWRLAEGDTRPWSEANVVELFRPQVDYYRSSVRGAAGKPVHVKKVKGFKTNTTTFLQYQRGAGIYAVASDTTDSTLVDD